MAEKKGVGSGGGGGGGGRDQLLLKSDQRPVFSKVPKSVWARKAMTKILNLIFTELSFSHHFNTNKVNFNAKLNAYTLLSFLDTDH